MACATIFFHADAQVLKERYEENVEHPNGYLVHVKDHWVFTDALATETADWARQLELAAVMSEDELVGFSVLLVGDAWVLAVAFDGQPGPMAVFAPGNEAQMRKVPEQLLEIEQALTDLFPEAADTARIDALFVEVLEGGLPIDEAVETLVAMLGCPPEWLRWAWYETIPEQIFIDPDLAGRVAPLGDARLFWEE